MTGSWPRSEEEGRSEQKKRGRLSVRELQSLRRDETEGSALQLALDPLGIEGSVALSQGGGGQGSGGWGVAEYGRYVGLD